MHFKFKNVNHAFLGFVGGIHSGDIPTDVVPSRNGETLTVREPVIVSYDSPRDRVLLNRARDANPFFHVYEFLWMIAGRNDIAPLCYYNSKYAEFSDDGRTANGAYGYRWRRAGFIADEDYTRAAGTGKKGDWVNVQTGIDQLEILISHLRGNPYSRRAVLDIWNVEDDLLKIGEGNCTCRPENNGGEHFAGCRVKHASKDVCCNLSVMFSVESGSCAACGGKGSRAAQLRGGKDTEEELTIGGNCTVCGGTPSEQPRYLNMTVTNRSNDLIWGLLGANVVHFSYLQEYMACALGLEVGTYNQFTNNLHCYTWNWKPEKWLDEKAWLPNLAAAVHKPLAPGPLLFTGGEEGRLAFDKDCAAFVEANKNGEEDSPEEPWGNEFLDTVAQPMIEAFHFYKRREWIEAGGAVAAIASPAWQAAADAWMVKRSTKKGRHDTKSAL